MCINSDSSTVSVHLKLIENHISAFFEARTPPGVKNGVEFIRYSSGSDRGNAGIEIWFNKCQPIKFGKKQFLI